MTPQLLVTISKHVPHPGIHTATTNPCLVTRQKQSTFSDVVSFSDAQKRCASRHSHSHDKSVFSDAAAFSVGQKPCSPRHSHSRDKSVFSDTANKLAFSDAVSFSELRKYVHLGIHTATTNPCLGTRVVTLHRLVTLRKDGNLAIHTATTTPCLVTRRKGQRSMTLQRLVTLR